MYAAGRYTFNAQTGVAGIDIPGMYGVPRGAETPAAHDPDWMQALAPKPEYLYFTFVRNPYDRFVSYYLDSMEFQRRRGLQFYQNFRECLELTVELLKHDYPNPGVSLTEKFGPCKMGPRFLAWLLDHSLRQRDALARHKWNLSGDAGKLRDNALWSFIGRFENIKRDVHHLQEILHLPRIPALHENRSEKRLDGGRSRHYSEYYDPASRRIVAELYADDLELFGYEYEQPGAVSVPAPLYDLRKVRQYQQRFSRKERWIFRFQAVWRWVLWGMYSGFSDPWTAYRQFVDWRRRLEASVDAVLRDWRG